MQSALVVLACGLLAIQALAAQLRVQQVVRSLGSNIVVPAIMFGLTTDLSNIVVLNGQQMLYFQPSEAFDVTVINGLRGNATLIHPHGFVLPLAFDGVPFISSLPIEQGAQRIAQFSFAPENANGSGTYFFHSHYGEQHTMGLSLPLLINTSIPQAILDVASAGQAPTSEAVMFLEDICPYSSDDPSENAACDSPHDVYATLLAGWLDEQPFNFTECSEPASDDDVYFRYHTTNGRLLSNPVALAAAPGQLVRLRIISSSIMTHYKIVFDDALAVSAFVVAVDGQWIKPVASPSFYVSVAQRADVLFVAPTTPGAYLIRAITANFAEQQLQSGLVVVVGGSAFTPPAGTYSPDVPAAERVAPMSAAQELSYSALFPLPVRPIDRQIVVRLTGDNGFAGIDERGYQLPPSVPVYAPNPFPLGVRQGERVCLTLVNFNADAHPIHLHGHVFAVTAINGVSFAGALRDTVFVPPGSCNSVDICFDASHPGVWPLHCHMSYHMEAGMFTTVEYAQEPPASHALRNALVILAASLVVLAGMLAAGLYAWRRSGARTSARPQPQPVGDFGDRERLLVQPGEHSSCSSAAAI